MQDAKQKGMPVSMVDNAVLCNFLLTYQTKFLYVQPLSRHLLSLSENLLVTEWSGCGLGDKLLINNRSKKWHGHC